MDEANRSGDYIELPLVATDDDMRIALDRSKDLVWHWYWCAKDETILAQNFADVHDHVQCGRSIVQRLLGFRDLDGREVTAVREADRGADRHGGTCQHPGGEGHTIGLDADRSDIVFPCQPGRPVKSFVCADHGPHAFRDTRKKTSSLKTPE